MGCIKRENTGTCNHFQCPYTEDSGFECVDLLDFGTICENSGGSNYC